MNTLNVTIVCITILIGIIFFVWANSNELVNVKGYEVTIRVNKITSHKCTSLNPLNIDLEKNGLPQLCDN